MTDPIPSEYLADHRDTVTTDGFVDGQLCNRDYHCESERCTWDYVCTAKQQDDEVCQRDNHCQSGRCASTIPLWRCRPLLDVGDGCGNSGDCKPGLKCEWSWDWLNTGNQCVPSTHFAATGVDGGEVQIVS